MHKGWLIGLSSVVVAGLGLIGLTPAEAADETSYIITVPDGTVAPLVADLAALGENPDHVYSAAVDGVAATLSSAEVAAIKEETPGVTVTPDVVVSIDATQTGATWGISALDQATAPADSSYTYPDSAGLGVDVFVIDTGVGASTWQFPGTLDATRARDFTGIGSWYDGNGHGTHVAGTIASQTYGVAKKATIIPVRVLGANGSGYLSDVIAGVNYAVTAKTPGKTAVLNLSLGVSARISALDDAVNAAVDAGIVAAVAAGNSSIDACNASPAGASKVLTVGALDNSGSPASFSNYGSCVEVYGPGVSITSIDKNNQPWTISGTSMASPHAAGSAALYIAQNPTATAVDVTAAIVAASNSTCSACNPNRVLNIQRLVAPEVVASVPGVPSSPVVTSLSADAASISWTAPANTGTSAIDYYTVSTRPSGSTTWTTRNTVGAATSMSLSSLSPSASYDVRVSAHNAVGSGSPSAITTLTTLSGVPTAPLNFVAIPASSSAQLTWQAPASTNGAPLVSYIVEYKRSSQTTWSRAVTLSASASAPPPTAVTVTKLQKNAVYTFRVTAKTAYGQASTTSSAVQILTVIKKR